jgi:hypothetical protein
MASATAVATVVARWGVLKLEFLVIIGFSLLPE